MEGFHVKDHLVGAILSAALLAVGASVHAQEPPAAPRPAPGQPAPPAAAQRQSPLADRVKTALSASFTVNMTRVDNQSLQVAVNERLIDEEIYVKLVTATCTSVGADARQL